MLIKEVARKKNIQDTVHKYVGGMNAQLQCSPAMTCASGGGYQQADHDNYDCPGG